MRIAITGASGFIGSSLSSYLKDAGHDVSPLVRKKPDISANEIYWNPFAEEIDKDNLEGHDAVVNLAGKNLSEERWTKRTKQLLHESRIQSTEFLCRALSELKKPPEVLISASAVGYYGDRADELLTESSPAGKGFLAQLCLDWEWAPKTARTAGIRVPDNNIAISLVSKLGNPVLSTSATHPDGKVFEDPSLLHDYFGNSLDAVIDGGPVAGSPSSVVSLIDDEPEIIRYGAGDVALFE